MTRTDTAPAISHKETQHCGSTAFTLAGPLYAPAVVLIHGVGMNRAIWDAQVADLAVDHAVITYDLLGHGESALPPEPTRLTDLSDQLLALLDALDIRCAHLVGHSMGALVATEFALCHPERVDRLIALNAVYRRSPEQRREVIKRADEIAGNRVLASTDETIRRWFTPAERSKAPEAIAQIQQWLDSADLEGYARIYKAFASSDEAFVGRLGGLTAPALFMTGSEDPNSTPDMSRRLAAEAPNAAAEILNHERHMMAYIAPTTVNARIRAFLAGCDANSNAGSSQGLKDTESLSTGSNRGE